MREINTGLSNTVLKSENFHLTWKIDKKKREWANISLVVDRGSVKSINKNNIYIYLTCVYLKKYKINSIVFESYIKSTKQINHTKSVDYCLKKVSWAVKIVLWASSGQDNVRDHQCLVHNTIDLKDNSYEV